MSTGRGVLPGWAFYAFGDPAPQGSKRHAGHGVMIESSKRLKPWRDTIAGAGVGAGPCLDGPLAVAMVFTARRPLSANRRQVVPDRTPDLSKLARAAEDAVTTAGLWTDDARVAVYAPLAKVYPGYPYPGVPDQLVLPAPGVLIAAVEISPAVEIAAPPPAEIVDPAGAAAQLGVPKVAVVALAAGAPITPEQLEAWAEAKRSDPRRFAATVADARNAEQARRAAERAARARPAETPDYLPRLHALAATACADARARSERWRAAIGA